MVVLPITVGIHGFKNRIRKNVDEIGEPGRALKTAALVVRSDIDAGEAHGSSDLGNLP